MRPAATSILLLLSACGGPTPPGNDGAPAGKAAVRQDNAANTAEPSTNEGAAPEIPGDDALADMSPRQRRAYDLGFRDCSAGRYEPDPHPEAYRIGCGAAQEAKGGGGPEG